MSYRKVSYNSLWRGFGSTRIGRTFGLTKGSWQDLKTRGDFGQGTRDLQDLVAKGALTKTGEFRYTRYYLK